jgi:DNA repair protein RadC
MSEQEKKSSIKNWAEDDRPREKLLLKGKNALSDAELIAILIGSGSRNESAVELCKRILDSVNGNLVELSKLGVSDLSKFRGIGEAKALSIVAALELGRRRRESEVLRKARITSSRDSYEILQSVIGDSEYEQFWVLMLNQGNRLLKKINISEGGITGTVVDPRKVLKAAIECGASNIVLGHNHPSGNLHPSSNDTSITRKLKEAAKLIDVVVIDHIILGENGYYSFADEGIM